MLTGSVFLIMNFVYICLLTEEEKNMAGLLEKSHSDVE